MIKLFRNSKGLVFMLGALANSCSVEQPGHSPTHFAYLKAAKFYQSFSAK
jgi:hypothetical protein